MHNQWKKHLTKILIVTMIMAMAVASGHATETAQEPPLVPESFGALFTQGKLNLTIRSLLFMRDYDDETTDWSSLVIGGNVGFETAPVYGFSAGVGVKAGYGDTLSSDEEIYRGLLATGDTLFDAKGYIAFDEYYLRFNRWNTRITGGAHRVDSPWLNARDIRLTPYKYRALSIINQSIDTVALHGYYIHERLDWTDESWKSVATVITGNEEDEEGSLIGGVVWNAPGGLKLQVWDYYFMEVLNSFYARLDGTYTWRDEYTVSAAIKYLNQSDVGDALDGDISAYTAGGHVSLAAYGATLTGYYGWNGKDELRDPFGGDWVITMQNKDLDRAEEEAWGVKLFYDFARLGAAGLSAYAYFARFDTPDEGEYVSPDMDELDLSLKYQFTGRLKNVSIWLRYAIIDQDESIEGGRDWTDGRVYLQYKF